MADQKIEDEVVDAGCFATAILEEIEIWPARFIQGHNLTINDRAFWKLGKGLNDQWIVVVEEFAPPGKKVDAAIRFDRDGAIARRV